MESASQSLPGLLGHVVNRARFDVTIVTKDGERKVFTDAVVDHADGWLLVCEYADDNWCTRTTNGYRSDGIAYYKVSPQQAKT